MTNSRDLTATMEAQLLNAKNGLATHIDAEQALKAKETFNPVINQSALEQLKSGGMIQDKVEATTERASKFKKGRDSGRGM